ncbi:MAG: insulinase family protein [Alphaproteobacteria bacterium]|nr:insulinase family protein [Alphaproteobacteria bacterium]
MAEMASATVFKAEEFVLPNGLRCVVVENHKAPLIKHMVWYKAGSVDEEAGKGGSAHLLEHLMFRGTKKVKDGAFNEIMEKHGAVSNAFTTHEVTAYHEFADISRLEVLMALESDRMQNLNFDKQAFETERKIVFQERMQRIENNPSSIFSERFDLLLWGNSPYGRPVTGLAEEIESLTYDDALSFYQRFYAPNNAILVLSGDIDAATVKPLVEKYYGKLQSHKVKRQNPVSVRPYFRETLEMELPDINTVKMVESYILDTTEEIKDEVYDYAVLAEYLGGGETSALYRDLVLKNKEFVSVFAGYNFVTNGNTVFSFSLLPVEGNKMSLTELSDILHHSAENAVKNLTDKRLEQIKRKMVADLVYANDNPADAAQWIGYMLASGFSLADIQNYEEKISSVTLSGVKQAFKNLQKASGVKGLLKPLSSELSVKGKSL